MIVGVSGMTVVLKTLSSHSEDADYLFKDSQSLSLWKEIQWHYNNLQKKRGKKLVSYEIFQNGPEELTQ